MRSAHHAVDSRALSLRGWLDRSAIFNTTDIARIQKAISAGKANGVKVEVVKKVLEGRPHIVDAMKNGEVQLVFNTTEGAQAIKDSFAIRRTALTRNICHYTTLSGAEAAIEAIAALKDGALDVAPLQPYFKQ